MSGPQDLTTLDENYPKGNIEPVSALDNYQRETRAKLKANLAIEHDLATGIHKVNTLPSYPTNGRLYYDRIRDELLYYFKDTHYDSWRSVIQPPFNLLFNPEFKLASLISGFGNIPAGWGISTPTGGWGGVDHAFRYFGWQSFGFNNPVASGGFATVGQLFSTSLPRWLPIDYWRGRTITFGAYVFCEQPNRAVLGIHDGTIASYSPNQWSGSGQWDWLSVTHTVGAGATDIQVQVINAPGAASSTTYFAMPTLVEGTWCTRPTPQGHPQRSHVMNFGHVNGISQAMNLTRYFGPYGRSGNEFLVSEIIPYRFNAHNLFVYSYSPPGAGQQLDCRIRYNNTIDSELTGIIAGTSQSFNDDTHSLYGDANGTLSLRVIGSAGVAATAISATLQIDELPW